MGKKASSSGAVKPPMAADLLDFYTPEQLRAHWLSLGLGEKPVSFSPKPWETDEAKRNDPRVADPALKESALLTNVFNRLARSCFYGAASSCGGMLPAGPCDPAVADACEQALLAFEQRMYVLDFPGALRVADDFIRDANKRWSDASKAAKNAGDEEALVAALRDAFAALRCAAVLMHPAVPQGCEMICDYFGFDAELFFGWEHAFASLDELTELAGQRPGEHAVKELPPRTDFFSKHPSQQ
jgi:methionyl-tRNA synthetase